MQLTAEADLSAAPAVWSSGAVGTTGCAAEGELLFVHGVVVSHLDLWILMMARRILYVTCHGQRRFDVELDDSID